LRALAGRLTWTLFEAANYESGSRRFEKIARFATVDCVKAGRLVTDRARRWLPLRSIRFLAPGG
jgi:restriction system protein